MTACIDIQNSCSQAKNVHHGSIPVMPIKTVSGESATVSLKDPSGRNISVDNWLQALAKPEKLLDNPISNLGAVSLSRIVIQEIELGGKKIKCAIKYYSNISYIRQIFRFSRAESNFKTAAKLFACGIPTAYPLAAIELTANRNCPGSMFISEYQPDSKNLYHFCRQDLALCKPLQKKDLCEQIARIFAGLDDANLRHRDAKAGNFLVCSDGEKIRVVLVDMDGIRLYKIKSYERRFGSLAKLASTILCHSLIYTTDYFRVFRSYCNLLGIDKALRKKYLRKVTAQAAAMRLLTAARSCQAEICAGDEDNGEIGYDNCNSLQGKDS